MNTPTPDLSSAELPDPSSFESFHPFIKGVFSQWHQSAFVLEGLTFVTAEQWMMFAKAKLFDDGPAAEAIMATPDPAEQKRRGQQVRGFDHDTWSRWKVAIVYRGSLAKFSQNEGAARQLRSTAPAMLVEANPRDWIWGCGWPMDDPRALNPAEWRGENLLGRILTQVRDELAAS